MGQQQNAIRLLVRRVSEYQNQITKLRKLLFVLAIFIQFKCFFSLKQRSSSFITSQHHNKPTTHPSMFRKLFTQAQTLYPQFRHLNGESMLPSFLNELGNNIYFTPKIQKLMYSDQLVKYMAFLSRKRTVDKQDMRSLTENILTEFGNVYQKAGLEEEMYGFQKGFKVKQEQGCSYHGTVDYMVYLNKTHFFPVMFFENELNPFCGAGMALSNMVMKSNLRQQPKTSGYSLITNGQQWQMYKIYRSLKLQKSVLYQAKNNKFKNLYEDHEMVSVIMGLVDQCLDVERPEVETLKIAYDFIDDQRFMIEAKEGEKIKEAPVSRLLTKYYQKKKDWNSK